jgi:hypothetical protein
MNEGKESKIVGLKDVLFLPNHTVTRVAKLPDGTLVGVAVIRELVRVSQSRTILVTANFRVVPFKGNKILEEVEGKKIVDCSKVYLLPDETLAGVIIYETLEKTVKEGKEVYTLVTYGRYFFWYGEEVYLPTDVGDVWEKISFLA